MTDAKPFRMSTPPPPLGKGEVLLVEDQPALRRAYARVLEGGGYSVTESPDGQDAASLPALERFDVIVTDISMPRMSGSQLLRAIRERNLDIPVLLVTANPSVESAVDALEGGALRYLIKPVPPAELLAAVERATKISQLAKLRRESSAYLAAIERQAGEQPALEAKLRSAIDSLWMAYQPIVDWTHKRVVAFEALVRSDDPTLPNPQALFSLASRCNSASAVGLAIRTSVAKTLAENTTDKDVFVNLHPCDLIEEALFSPGDPLAPYAKRIVLEITEREALDGIADISKRARRLRELGYRLAIDDLGAGYAGLTSFVQLTPEVVKIDMSLVRDVHLEKIKQKLIWSLNSLCKNMGMSVIAEGIETEQERRVITGLGCNLLQGFYFAKPARPFPDVHWGS
jgi:EAL domain-containing protein (putative c-di-GMP-specific phosphodiesterase class I)/CheY-like chemotaxis protein